SCRAVVVSRPATQSVIITNKRIRCDGIVFLPDFMIVSLLGSFASDENPSPTRASRVHSRFRRFTLAAYQTLQSINRISWLNPLNQSADFADYTDSVKTGAAGQSTQVR